MLIKSLLGFFNFFFVEEKWNEKGKGKWLVSLVVDVVFVKKLRVNDDKESEVKNFMSVLVDLNDC